MTITGKITITRKLITTRKLINKMFLSKKVSHAMLFCEKRYSLQYFCSRKLLIMIFLCEKFNNDNGSVWEGEQEWHDGCHWWCKNCIPSETPWLHHTFSFAQSLALYVVICRTLFVFLSYLAFVMSVPWFEASNAAFYILNFFLTITRRFVEKVFHYSVLVWEN